MTFVDSLFLATRGGDRRNPDNSNGVKKSEEICSGLEVSSEIDVLPKGFKKSTSKTSSNPLLPHAEFAISVISFFVCEVLLTSFDNFSKLSFTNLDADLTSAASHVFYWNH